jgi:hypothetical protein
VSTQPTAWGHLSASLFLDCSSQARGARERRQWGGQAGVEGAGEVGS